MTPLSTVTIDGLLVKTYLDTDRLVEGVISEIYDYLNDLIHSQGYARIILASGSSQIKFLEKFIQLPLDWSKITCFHLDEYLGIEPDHPASFQLYMRTLVSDHVPLQSFHYLEGGTIQPLQECDRYGKLLTQTAIDLCLLGVGDNGHIAFNDPEVADFQDPYLVKLIKLAEISRQQQVNNGFFSELRDVPNYAFTLTIPAICQSKKIICLAMGEKKSTIVNKILTEPISTKYPATVLRQQPQSTLYLDQGAAKNIVTD
jgi:glucosamine-6-phosphate deaminase